MKVAIRSDAPRTFVSRFLKSLWPQARPEHYTEEILFKQETALHEEFLLGAPVSLQTSISALSGVKDILRHRRFSGNLDISPLSGDLFADGRLIPNSSCRGLVNVKPAAIDLTRHIFPRRVRREPIVPLYNGAKIGILPFITQVLPRFFCLDRIGVPIDTLCTVSLHMGMTDLFQDALNDGLFRPRPVEVQRRNKLLSADRIDLVEAPLLDREGYELIWEKLSSIYQRQSNDITVIFLCTGGRKHARRIFSDWAFIETWLEERDVEIIDPLNIPLRELVAKLSSATKIMAPDTGDATSFLLAGRKPETVVEWSTKTPANPISYLMTKTAGKNYIYIDETRTNLPKL